LRCYWFAFGAKGDDIGWEILNLFYLNYAYIVLAKIFFNFIILIQEFPFCHLFFLSEVDDLINIIVKYITLLVFGEVTGEVTSIIEASVFLVLFLLSKTAL